MLLPTRGASIRRRCVKVGTVAGGALPLLLAALASPGHGGAPNSAASASGVIHGGPRGESAGGVCSRKPPRPFEDGAVVTIAGAAGRCELTFVQTGVRLETSPEGEWMDPGWSIARDSRGRFYAKGELGWFDRIGVWDETGKYVATVGRRGQGPGEFLGGGMDPYVDGSDNLYVRDGLLWKVFSPDHDFLRNIPTREVLARRWETAILDDGRILEGVWYAMDAGGHHFRFTDTAGVFQFFGEVTPGNLARVREWPPANGGTRLRRAIGYEGGDIFWAGPVDGDPDGYVLEEWGTDGRRRRSIRRDVARDAPWWKVTKWQETSSRVTHVHVHDGLLFVRIVRLEGRRVTQRGGEDGHGHPDRIAWDREGFPQYFLTEVIDARSGELLASTGVYRSVAAEQGANTPHFYFRDSMLGYQHRQDRPGGGLPIVPIVKAVVSER